MVSDMSQDQTQKSPEPVSKRILRVCGGDPMPTGYVYLHLLVNKGFSHVSWKTYKPFVLLVFNPFALVCNCRRRDGRLVLFNSPSAASSMTASFKGSGIRSLCFRNGAA